MKDRKMLVSIIAIVVLIALAGTAIFCWNRFRPQTIEGAKVITVEVTHKDGSVNTYDISTDAEYLYDAMCEEGIIGVLTDGYFVEVDGETADTQAQEWWGYTKSGEYVNYGASECVIADGDHYEFTFNVGW